MAASERPRFDLARKILPRGLINALQFIFAQKLEGVALVGGTALAGFYAGHRCSDDIDLFTRNVVSQEAAIRAILSLKETYKGVQLSDEFHSAQYYHTNCIYQGHRFTIDIVLDANLFRVGKFLCTENQIYVADLKTILKTKAATLVSRCSEKDLFDLMWLFENAESLELGLIHYENLIELGKEIDAGVSGESILLSVSGTQLSKESCDFVTNEGKDKVFKKLCDFKNKFVKELSIFLHQRKDTDLSLLVRSLKKLINTR